MPKILRYNLITDRNLDLPGGPILMPAGSTVLSAAIHPTGPSVWALTTETVEPEKHYFAICSTGKDLPPDMEDQRFLATITTGTITPQGAKVTVDHIFELQPHFALKHA